MNTNGNLALNNVQTIGVNDAYNIIHLFMEKKKRKSDNTYDAYGRYYNEFFQFTVGKKLEYITWNDILQITYTKVEEYQEHELAKGNQENTCNQKLFAIKKLWESLHRHNNNVSLDVLDFEPLDSKDNSYAILTTDEVELLLEFAKCKYKGNVQSMVFEFLFVVGCRKEMPFVLTRDMITKNYDYNSGKNAWVIKYKEKGKYVEKSITDEFYEKLIVVCEEGSEKIFNISDKTIEKTFDEFRKEYGLKEKNGKKVVIHSIKKASGLAVYKATGDLVKTKDHMQHDHIDMTSRIYLDSSQNYCSQGSYMLGETIGTDIFENMTKEELIQLIGECGSDVIRRMKYIMDNRK